MSFKKKPVGFGKKPNLHALGLQNIRSARRRWGVSSEQVSLLKALTQEFQLSVPLGDLSLLDGKWYVTHSGLLRLARRNRCAGIQVRPMPKFSDPLSARWVFCATVYSLLPRSGSSDTGMQTHQMSPLWCGEQRCV